MQLFTRNTDLSPCDLDMFEFSRNLYLFGDNILQLLNPETYSVREIAYIRSTLLHSICLLPTVQAKLHFGLCLSSFS